MLRKPSPGWVLEAAWGSGVRGQEAVLGSCRLTRRSNQQYPPSKPQSKVQGGIHVKQQRPGMPCTEPETSESVRWGGTRESALRAQLCGRSPREEHGQQEARRCRGWNPASHQLWDLGQVPSPALRFFVCDRGNNKTGCKETERDVDNNNNLRQTAKGGLDRGCCAPCRAWNIPRPLGIRPPLPPALCVVTLFPPTTQ